MHVAVHSIVTAAHVRPGQHRGTGAVGAVGEVNYNERNDSNSETVSLTISEQRRK